MAFWDGTLGVALGLFIILALAERARYREKRARAFRLLAAAAFFFAVVGVLDVPNVFLNVNGVVQNILLFIGELAAVVAVIFLAIDSLKDWEKDLKV